MAFDYILGARTSTRTTLLRTRRDCRQYFYWGHHAALSLFAAQKWSTLLLIFVYFLNFVLIWFTNIRVKIYLMFLISELRWFYLSYGAIVLFLPSLLYYFYFVVITRNIPSGTFFKHSGVGLTQLVALGNPQSCCL